MQRTKSKILSILLSLVMLLSLLPTTALAAGIPDPTSVLVDGGKSFLRPSKLYYKNGNESDNFTGNAGDYNAHYDPVNGILTLKDYDGGQITLGGASQDDLTIKLIGNNTVTVNGGWGIGANGHQSSITITADSSSTLTIKVTSNSGSDSAGIDNCKGSGKSGDVTIKGYADVTINTTTKRAGYGIYAKNVIIEENAKVAVTVNAPDNTGGGLVYGIFAETNATINTAGAITVDVSNAGTGDRVYSTGVNSKGDLTLTKVGGMTVKWNSKIGTQGAPFYPNASFDSAAYDFFEDTTNWTVTYTPKAATANISLSETGTVDFGSMEAGYSAAPAAQTVTITNSGTAATGALTIALDGANASSFTLSTTNIADVADGGGTGTFTVQPKTGLSADTYTATVKVSGTGAGVTEKSFDVKFTVTAPLTAIAVPTANSVIYDGTKQTGVNAGTGYTLGAPTRRPMWALRTMLLPRRWRLAISGMMAAPVSRRSTGTSARERRPSQTSPLPRRPI